jgi:phage regulator Rha-like protein
MTGTWRDTKTGKTAHATVNRGAVLVQLQYTTERVVKFMERVAFLKRFKRIEAANA